MESTADIQAPAVETPLLRQFEALPLEVMADAVAAPTSLESIRRLQAAMQDMPQLEMRLNHHFAPGIYVRELVIPAGAVVVGKLHATEHLSIMSKGKLNVATEEGCRTLEAPCVFVAPRGTKRAVFALEETIFINVHPNPTNETDLEKLESIFIIPEKITLESEARIAQLTEAVAA